MINQMSEPGSEGSHVSADEMEYDKMMEAQEKKKMVEGARHAEEKIHPADASGREEE